MNKIKEIDTNNEDELLAEIERLRNDPYVKLAKQAQNKALKQKLYQLRSLEKQGRELAKSLNKEANDG